jgi:hypothetical protein
MCIGTIGFGPLHLALLAFGAIVTTASAQTCERFQNYPSTSKLKLWPATIEAMPIVQHFFLCI